MTDGDIERLKLIAESPESPCDNFPAWAWHCGNCPLESYANDNGDMCCSGDKARVAARALLGKSVIVL